MPTIQKLASLGLLLLSTTLARAETPDILGTWVGVSSATVIGTNEYFGTQPGDRAQFLETEFTLLIETAEGRSFAGRVFSVDDGVQEPVAGVFKADLKTGVMADYDGTYTFALTAPGRLELCYSHSASATGRSIVAACNELERQDGEEDQTPAEEVSSDPVE